jgi:hypothetical protein
LAAVAFDTSLEFEARLRAGPRPTAAVEPEMPLTSAANTAIEPWEVHSELVLVCPEVYKRALELLPERDPEAFQHRPRDPIVLAAGTADKAQNADSLPVAVLGYALWRLAETARTAFWAVGTVIALALLAQVFR